MANDALAILSQTWDEVDEAYQALSEATPCEMTQAIACLAHKVLLMRGTLQNLQRHEEDDAA